MGIVVRFEKQKALLREGVWRCADLALEQRLNDLTGDWIVETGKPAIGSHDPEREVAAEMARRLDGAILYHAPSKSGEAARHFFKKRQLKLF